MNLITKYSLIVQVSLISFFSFGQNYYMNKNGKSYFGLTGGVNYTIPKVTDSYSVLTSVEGDEAGIYEKKYDKFGFNRAVQFGIRYNYNFKFGFSIVADFVYQAQSFGYFTDYSWSDTINNQDFEREMHHLQKVSYFSFPLMVRLDFTKSQFMPYVQAGMFMDFRHQAKKVINYDNSIDSKETENQLSSSSEVSITDFMQKFNMGLIGGAGLQYHTKFATFGLESNFRFGFMKVVNDDMRYSDVNGFALQYLDVFDQLKWRNLNFNITVSIPISNGVAMNVLRKRQY